MKIVIFLVGLLAFSFTKRAQSTTREGIEFDVEFLFEKDGVRVYRFYDNRYHYFTTNGETMSTYRSGKTDYTENISSNPPCH